MEMYVLLMKGFMAEMPEDIKEFYKTKLEEYKEDLSTDDENKQCALMAAMFVSLEESGLLKD